MEQDDLNVHCVNSDGTKQIVVGGFRRDLEILDSDGHRLPGAIILVSLAHRSCWALTLEGCASFGCMCRMAVPGG